MKALICGSYAYDNIMVFQDRFKNHILPDKVHMLNVSFLVPEMRREFGGCAGNIAYNMKLLGHDPLPMATVGRDYSPYGEWSEKVGVDQTYIKVIDNTFTAQAFITTDLDDNQITAFHPGAMNFSQENTVPTDQGIKLGIISPDGRDGMIEHAQQFAEADIPFIFDPGQGMPMFDGTDLLNFVDKATWVTMNDYEAQMLQEKTGKSLDKIAQQVKALIVTLGGEGSHIYTQGKRIDIPTPTPATIADPTGCGDAYRAGLMHGLLNDYDWETTGRIASLMGALKIEHPGTQNHNLTMQEIKDRFVASYDRKMA
ncbi:MAG: carbohydrate kinase family protein [Gammaproteobacteria bacterium]|nr:carbohydrate kinase family protein [Gammaproteobacteria bacterium]